MFGRYPPFVSLEFFRLLTVRSCLRLIAPPPVNKTPVVVVAPIARVDSNCFVVFGEGFIQIPLGRIQILPAHKAVVTLRAQFDDFIEIGEGFTELSLLKINTPPEGVKLSTIGKQLK